MLKVFQKIMISRINIVAKSFRGFGILVLLIAFVHLYATRLIQEHVLARIKDAALHALIAPGYLLDHIVVGVFMLPIGFLMYWSAPALKDKQRWAYVMNMSFCIAILTTPLLILWLMSAAEFNSPLFALSALVLSAIGVISCLLLFWVRREF
jgi:hypothetical protein